MSLGPQDLVLCAGTIPLASFRERVEAAAEAGFSAISLFLVDYHKARGEGLSDANLRALLADNGLALAELDALLDWIPGTELGRSANEAGAEMFQYGEDDFYAAADALGARSINAVAVTDPPVPRDLLAEAFGKLCERAAAHGLLVHLEFLPWTEISDVGSALDVVERAGHPAGGVMLDTWHHFRSGADAHRLREIPAERIFAVQLSDAPGQAEDDLVEETLRRRLLPGEGDIDLVEVVDTLDQIGATAPLGVEVFSDELLLLSPREAAQRAGNALRAIIARARQGDSPGSGKGGGFAP